MYKRLSIRTGKMKKVVIKVFPDAAIRVHTYNAADFDVALSAVALLMNMTKRETLNRTMAKRIAAKLNAYADGKEDDEG